MPVSLQENSSLERDIGPLEGQRENFEGSADELEESEEEEDDDDASEDIEQIAQYQHKILRKYAMLGFIRYSAIPFFHQLVHIHDYKMSCIFEVFAKNRNDEDFLENLKILDDIRTRTEEIQVLSDMEPDEQQEYAEPAEAVQLFQAVQEPEEDDVYTK